jgi:hypothetical protein
MVVCFPPRIRGVNAEEIYGSTQDGAPRQMLVGL